MSVLFLSHASRDDEISQDITQSLKALGHVSVFIDHDKLLGGEQWEERLYTELRRCRALVAIVTPEWLNSRWCIAEANHAQALRKPVIPILAANKRTNRAFADLLKSAGPPVFARVEAIDWTKGAENANPRLAKSLSAFGLDASNVFLWDGKRPLYPGLPPFERNDAALFFGREQETNDLLAQLDAMRAPARSRLLTIQGASGSGKSSLLRAGLVPRLERMTEKWIVLPPFRPLNSPFSQLAQAFNAVGSVIPPPPEIDGDEQSVVSHWAKWIIDASVKLQQTSKKPEATVLISIDQLEEAVRRQRADAFEDDASDQATRFLLALQEALATSDHRLIVIATLRADSIGPFQRHRAITGRASTGDNVACSAYQLGPLPRKSFHAIVQGPAEIANLRFDSGLIGRIVDETATDDALPLLAFALHELWVRHGEDDLHISKAEYDSFGGIEKAVGDKAEAEYQRWIDGLKREGLDERQISLREDLFRRFILTELASFTEDERLIRVPVPWSDVPEDIKGIVTAFCDEKSRLMTSHGDTVEVSHEALFRRWERLLKWRKDAEDLLPTLRMVKRSYRESENGLGGPIPSGNELVQAQKLLASGLIKTDGKLAAYVNQSYFNAKTSEWWRRFWRRLGMIGGATSMVASVIAIVFLVFAIQKQTEMLIERDYAFSREAIRLAALSRVERKEGNVRVAVELALEAFPEQAPMENGSATALGGFFELPNWAHGILGDHSNLIDPAAEGAMMEALLTKPLDGPWLIGHGDGLTNIAWSPDGTRLATASWDDTGRIWDPVTGREIMALNGHESVIFYIAWSPDGKRLATASLDDTGRVWDAVTGREITVLEGHKDDVNHIAWSPDGTRLATASDDDTGRVWDAATGREITVLNGHEGNVTHIAWSPDGTRLATASWDDTGRIWDPVTGREIMVLNGHERDVKHMAWSPDGKSLAMASSDSTTRIWDPVTGREIMVLNGHESVVFYIAWSPDGKRLATASLDSTARVWDAVTGREITVLEGHKDDVNHIAWSPDGTRLATASDDDTGRVWDAATGREITALMGHERDVKHIAWSPDGTRLTTASDDNTGRVWDAVKDREIMALNGHESVVFYIAWSPDGKRLATASLDSTARVWDAVTGREITVLEGHKDDVNHIAWSPDGTRLATASLDDTGRVWDAVTGREITVLNGHEGNVTHIAWSPDGTRLATASDESTGRIWDPVTGREITILTGHAGSVNHIAWSPDGTRLATASDDDTGRIWDPVTGREIMALNGHESVVFYIAWSPNGKRLATASWDYEARVWDAETGGEITVLKGHKDNVNHIAWSPDGTRLATASEDDTGRIWDAVTGREISVLIGREGDVNHIAWSPDGTRLTTASDDDTGRVWDAATGREITVLMGHEDDVNHIAWSPDGTRLATASDDDHARIFQMLLRNWPVWLECAQGHIGILSSEANRQGKWSLKARPQLRSAATLIDPKTYLARYAAGKEACKIFQPASVGTTPNPSQTLQTEPLDQ